MIIGPPEEVKLHLPPSKTERSKGIHVSNIIRAIATEQGILKPEWAEELGLVDAREITDPVALLRINIGLAWEEHYIPMLEDVDDHPGEMEVDGIYMTHDGESVSVVMTERGPGLRVVIHEIKATYYSVNTVGDLSSRWMWLSQMKAYCKGRDALHAQLHALFLCGDYSYPIRPMLLKWPIEFTQAEIDQNWDLLRDYRDHWLEKQEGLII